MEDDYSDIDDDASSKKPAFVNQCLKVLTNSKSEASDVLDRLGLEPKKYILLSAHREENIDTEKNFTSLSRRSISWLRSMICPFCIPVIHAPESVWKRLALSWTNVFA